MGIFFYFRLNLYVDSDEKDIYDRFNFDPPFCHRRRQEFSQQKEQPPQ